MEVIESHFNVEPLPEEQMFKVSLSEVHKVSADELIRQHTGLDSAVTETKKRLEGLEEQKNQAQKALERELMANSPRAEAVAQHITQARVWKAQQDKENERRGKETQPEGGTTNENQVVQ